MISCFANVIVIFFILSKVLYISNNAVKEWAEFQKLVRIFFNFKFLFT